MAADTNSSLRLIGVMAPMITHAMQTVEPSSASGAEKREAVLELAGSIYEGLSRMGKLDGVKELKGVEWAALAPFVGLFVDGMVALFKRVGLWFSRKEAVK